MKIAGLTLATTTGATGSPQLRLAIAGDVDDVATTLDHRDVEQLADACQDFLDNRGIK